MVLPGFEWDDSKNEINFRKHGIDFETAALAFKDAFELDLPETSMDYGEMRSKLIGMTAIGLLTVIYTERGHLIRIISARRSSRREHDNYHSENSQK